MNVRISPFEWPARTDLYAGVVNVKVDALAATLTVEQREPGRETLATVFHLASLHGFSIDNDGADP